MYKFLRSKYTEFSKLPLEEFNELTIAVYLIDFDWTCLFVNDFVKKESGYENVVGKKLWDVFPRLASDPDFFRLKENLEKKIVTNFAITAVNSQKLNIVGYPFKDCYYISYSAVPDKEELIHELRSELEKKKI